MRKKLFKKLVGMYLCSFPPITPNGNNRYGEIKRTILAPLIGIVGGGKDGVEKLMMEINAELNSQTI